MIDYPLPVLGICAFSGTGKTTLLTHVLPILRMAGLRIALVKHAHHAFDIDHPGKDSYQLREAGASQVLVASRKRMALMREFETERGEPVLDECLAALDPGAADLVIVEGFKHAAMPKLELHRPSLGHALLCASDPHVVAVATDAPIALPRALPLLDLNDPEAVAEFILGWVRGG